MEEVKYIDLFSGIGGFRLALDHVGFKCVFSAEIDSHACEVYEANFGDNPYCDITKLDPKDIPDFDLLCAGFPCQAFSISGKEKGFYDARGTLFFDICRILKEKKPKAFVLENVKNLVTHNKGQTLHTMINMLKDIGYTVSYKVLNAKDFGVPQNRERVILVGTKKDTEFDFSKVIKHEIISMRDYLDVFGDFEWLDEKDYTILSKYKKQEKSGLIFIGYRNKNHRKNGVKDNTEHLSRCHKQPNRIYSCDGIHPTLSSSETSGRYFIYIDGKVRKLTVNECFRFMGFPEDFKKIGSKTNLYKRIGNSVCVNMIESIAIEVKKQIFNK